MHEFKGGLSIDSFLAGPSPYECREFSLTAGKGVGTGATTAVDL